MRSTSTEATRTQTVSALSIPAPKAWAFAEAVTATPSGFSDPDGSALTYRYQWSRNGAAIAGATTSTLDLSVAGRGDRGGRQHSRENQDGGKCPHLPDYNDLTGRGTQTEV